MATKGNPKTIVVDENTPPDELPPEFRGTIFDTSFVERGSHLNPAEPDNTIEGQLARIKEGSDDMTTETKTKPAKAATNGKAPSANKVSAKPAAPFDRVAASADWAATSPCLAATGPKRDPRACKGVGVVDRDTTGGKTIKVCAAHVLATEVATVEERNAAIADKAAAKDARTAAKAAIASKAAAAPKANSKANGTVAKATGPATPAKKAAKVDLTARA